MIRIAVPAGLLLALAGVAALGVRHQARDADALAQAEAQLRRAADRVQALEDLRPLCAAYQEWADRAEGMERLCAEMATLPQGQTPN